jgi:hypothetical protein
MGSEKFIHCCVCDAVHHVSPFDKAPAYIHVGVRWRRKQPMIGGCSWHNTLDIG